MARTEPSIDERLDALDHPHRETIDAIRAFLRANAPAAVELWKWNAPSFRLDDHFATLRVNPLPIVQLVLHRGSKPRPVPATFAIADPTGLLKWAAQDRCTVTFAPPGEAAHDLSALTALEPILASWIAQL